MKMIQSAYEYLIRSFVKQFFPNFHVSKGMKRSTRRAAFESLEDRHMLSASTFVEVACLSCETGMDAYVAQVNPTSDGVVPDEFIPELRNQLIEETTPKTTIPMGPYEYKESSAFLSVEDASIHEMTPAPVSNEVRTFIEAALAMEPDATSATSRQSKVVQGETSEIITLQ